AESSSLAGHLGLGRLTYYYDDNEISIDGSTSITFSEDVTKRFQAVGWHVLSVDGHDREAIASATDEALAVEDQPSLIICHTAIAAGAPNAEGTAKAHGSPLGDEEIRATKEAIGLPVDETFYTPDEVYEFFSQAMQKGRDARAAWQERFSAADGEARKAWEGFFEKNKVTIDGPDYEVGKSVATRNVNADIFPEIADKVPGFLGGAADLVESTKTQISAEISFTRDTP